MKKYSTKGKIYVAERIYVTGQKNINPVNWSLTAKSTAYKTCIQV
jgi:hypothetical protein